MINNFDFSHERDLLAIFLINRVSACYPDADFVMLRKALIYQQAHEGQREALVKIILFTLEMLLLLSLNYV